MARARTLSVNERTTSSATSASSSARRTSRMAALTSSSREGAAPRQLVEYAGELFRKALEHAFILGWRPAKRPKTRKARKRPGAHRAAGRWPPELEGPVGLAEERLCREFRAVSYGERAGKSMKWRGLPASGQAGDLVLTLISQTDLITTFCSYILRGSLGIRVGRGEATRPRWRCRGLDFAFATLFFDGRPVVERAFAAGR